MNRQDREDLQEFRGLYFAPSENGKADICIEIAAKVASMTSGEVDEIITFATLAGLFREEAAQA